MTAGDITFGTGSRPTGGDIVFGEEGDPSAVVLVMPLPVVPINTMLVALVFRDGAAVCNDPSWVQKLDGRGVGGVFLDAWVRQVDQAWLDAGTDTVAFLSPTEQELTGVPIGGLDIGPIDSIIEAAEYLAFAATTTPQAPDSVSSQLRNTAIVAFSAGGTIDFTPPPGFTVLEAYTSAAVAARSAMFAFKAIEDLIDVEPGSAVASPAATGVSLTLILHYVSPGLVQVSPRGIATPRNSLGLLDQFLDPVSLDYVDTDDGEWLETADSRTAVMIMIDTHLGKSYSAPGDGTRVVELLESGEPVTPELVAAEITRAMNLLAVAGMISNFSISVKDKAGHLLVDEAGRFTPELHYTDLATGSPVDLVYAPFQGAA